MNFWDAAVDADPVELTPDLLLKTADAIRNAPPHPCSLGRHVVSPRALHTPGVYICRNCMAAVGVPVPLSELATHDS